MSRDQLLRRYRVGITTPEKTNNDVHVVLFDGVGGNLLQACLLVAVVQLRAQDMDPSSVNSWNAENINTYRQLESMEILVR